MLRLVKWIAVLCALAAACAAGYVYWYVNDRIVPFDDGQPQKIVEIKRGATVKTIISELVRDGIDVQPDIAAQAFRYFEADKNIHVGRYLIESGWSLRQLIGHLASGKVIMSKFTLVEGTESKKFFDKILQDEDFELPEKPWTEEEIMKLVGAPEGTHPEGQFATDTYVFAAGAPVSLTLKQAYREQQKRLKEAWEGRDPSIAVKSPYELLILASIIEKETGSGEDRALVSSVFNNRLKKGMLLQTDPTVIYGVSDYNGKILKSHLKADHPYNTYIRPGLPPTPIANPGLAAIQAAAHPADTKYLYFVAMGDGKSFFSTNLKEHNVAVQKYLRSQGK